MAAVAAKSGIRKIKPHMLTGRDDLHPPPSILLNSNENAFGASPHALAAARAAISGIERYTEDPNLTLAPAIAARFGLDAGRITVGQGSDDLLARLARAYLGPGTTLVRSQNGYLKVPNYAYGNDAEVVSVRDENFVPSVERMIDALDARTRLVYLANPENPAGTYLSGAEVRRLHAAMPKNALLVIDAAYEEYVDAPDYEPAHKLVEEADNVVMCRTFSKIFGLAGARIGWLYGPPDVVDTLRRIALTFPLGSPAIAAALAALEDHEHTAAIVRANASGRSRLEDALARLGLNVIPSQANFVLVGVEGAGRAKACYDALLAQGIATRRFASAAYDDYLRITIAHPHEMSAAIGGIEAFLESASA